MKDSTKFLLIFSLTTLYFIIFNYLHSSWDFVSYVLNARYVLGQSYYFEPFRPPLMYVLLLPIIVLGKLAEYLYIIFICLIFAYSVKKLARVLRFNYVCLYALLFSPFMINNAMINGTELLTLSLLILSLYYIFTNNKLSGIFLGLTFLARYNAVIYLPLIFLQKKNKLKSLLLFVLALLPFFAVNKIFTGSIITSFADLYAINIFNRQDLAQTLSFITLIYPFITVLPFFVIGIVKDKLNYSMLYIFLATLLFFFRIPMKYPRYLFIISLPVAYYSYVGLKSIKKVKLAYLLFLLGFLIVVVSLNFKTLYAMELEKQALPLLNKSCNYESNNWVYLNYLGQPSSPLTQSNYSKVMFENESYRVVEGECKQKKFTKTYLEQTQERVFKEKNYLMNINPWVVLFGSDLFYNFGHH